MIAGFYQFCPVRGRPDENAARMEEALRASGADLLVCPELATSGYLYLDRSELLEVAEPVPDGPSVVRLARAARESGAAVVFGLPERQGDRVFNSAVFLGPDGSVVCYRKAHLFDTETLVFDRSGHSPRHGRAGGADVGLMICFDWRFPEVPRVLALLGADVLAHPSNLVFPQAQEAMITRSLENRVYTVTANRAGADRRPGGTVRFTGRSQITDPDGSVLARAGRSRETAMAADCDLAKSRDKSLTRMTPLFASRRPAYYRPLATARAGARR